MRAQERTDTKRKLELPHAAKERADSGDVPKTPPSWEADPDEQPSGIACGLV